MTEKTRTLSDVVIAAIITGCLSFGASYLTFRGDVATSRPDELAVVYQEMGKLRAEIRDLHDELQAVQAENGLLRIQLQDKWDNSPRSILWDYMEALDTPAWCKEWDLEDESRFRMVYINHSYEIFYDVTKERYIGASDFDVHPVQIAAAFKENDLRAYKRKGFVRFTEAIELKGSRQFLEFWKFYLELPDNGELICGIQVTE